MKHTSYSQYALVAYSSICRKMYASLCDNFIDLFMKHFSLNVKVIGTPTRILGSPFIVRQPFQCKI